MEVAEASGPEAMQWVVHTKKGTPAMHDWRPRFGQMLSELVANGGMKPQGGRYTEPTAGSEIPAKNGVP